MAMRDLAKSTEARVQAGLHRGGLHLTRYGATIHGRRQRLLSHAGVDCLIDVGANRGQYAGERRRHGYTGRLVSFEPLAGPFAELAQASADDPLWDAHQAAIGDHLGTIDIQVSDWDIYSSALPILALATDSDQRSRTVRTEQAPMTTLDAACAALDGTLGVKIDVQGFESSVLDGGSVALQRAVYLEMELSMVPLYEGQMLYIEALQRVDALGFVLAATEPLFPNPSTGQAMQMNGLFIRQS